MKVLAVTGASGGHIFPALSFLDSLKDKHRDASALLVLPEKVLGTGIIPDGYNVSYISIWAVNPGLNPESFFALLRFFRGAWQSLILILKFRPDVVVGFGSIASVPVVLWAWFFRIKTVIHEQNVLPGRANRLLAKFSDKIAVSFQESRDFFKGSSGKVVFTGNPIRKGLKRMEKDKALAFFGLAPDKFTLLAMGGSAGSHKINLELLGAISGMRDKARLQLIHLCGSGDYKFLEEGYKDLNVNFRLFAFLNQVGYAYSAADLVICRAGATTLAEVMFFGLPAIIIPYPFAYGHQAANAEGLKNRGCAVVIKDSELNKDTLRQDLEEFLAGPGKIKKMRAGYDNMAIPETDGLLVTEALK